MAKVVFYEKPGCGGNARQKALLVASGHELELRNLLTEPWTAETLRPFFGTRPVAGWFNMNAPQIKSGEVDPGTLTEAEALAAMLATPLLIRRPLLQVGDRREAGFEPALVHAWIGLTETKDDVDEICTKSLAPNKAQTENGARMGAKAEA